MKLIIKTPKPRNPLVVAARQRKAGAHEGPDSTRRVRRAERQNLQRLVKGRTLED